MTRVIGYPARVVITLDDRRPPCDHCGFEFVCDHADEHRGLCCDCYDLSWGMSLTRINQEREAKGQPTITKEWPGSA